MFKKYLRRGNFQLLKDSISNGENCSVFGLNIGEKLALIEDSAMLFYVVDSLENANIVLDKLSSLGRNPVFLQDFPNLLSSEFDNFEKTIEGLATISSGKCDTVVMMPEFLAASLPSPDYFKSITIRVGDEINITTLSRQLVQMGYLRVDIVSNKGEFAVRGDVIDIYSIGGTPIRIMSDFDVVESIREYNSVTLMTTQELQECEIFTNSMFSVSLHDVDDFYVENNAKRDDLYHELALLNSRDYRLLLVDKNRTYSVFDYVRNATIVFDGAKAIYDNLETYIKNYNERLKESSISKFVQQSKLDIKKALTFDKSHTLLAFHFIQQNNRIFAPTKVFSIRTLPAVNYASSKSALALDIENFSKQGFTVIMCAGTNENAERYRSLLVEKNIKCQVVSRISLGVIGEVNIVAQKYPLDIVLPEEKLAVISTTSLVGTLKKLVSNLSTSFLDHEVPQENDFVVHSFHGIGRCLGVKTVKISDALRDYVLIEYKGGDKVYLPVENLNQLSKYVGSEKAPQLNKIGGVEFSKAKTKVKTAVKKIAFDLIALYRERMNLKGFKYLQDDDMQLDFERSFGFSETIDQVKAINDCKADMENGKVMDRLVCGDVGFGKTEVALRIAFKTILGGKQVAILCPTTILSEQHYNTAKSRMHDFAVRIDVLNRLRSKKDEERIKNDFSTGKIDILCGTHKLLSKDIDYKNLGLLILDEEQKFGVADKEKIKNFKKHVNVLTLSATPIPRTLNMSLIGIRDISVIETPPTERIASDVQVMEYNEDIIRMAIERELARGGQVLVVYNKVEKIYSYASKIRAIVPDGTVVSVAHGQMQSDELEKEILNLYSGKTQVLVATTLIENGVDLPNANTLIVLNSDTLGLSQLYQLKGRIGRSDKSSYAYFMFDNRKILSDIAYKRLRAIKEFSQMGSGFKIAMRDLELRGAGNLLGAEQSGHIEKLGYNMYVQILNETVRELQGEKVDIVTDIKVETSLPAYIPHDFVSSSAIRMSLYKEIAGISSLDKLLAFKNKCMDILGGMSEEMENLCKIALSKNILSGMGVNKLVVKNTIKICFENRDRLSREIIDAISVPENCANLQMSQEPVIELNVQKGVNKLDFLMNFIGQIKNF